MRRRVVLLFTTPLAAVIVVLLLALLLIGTHPAHGSTLTVTNTNDDGEGSLRQAIEVANVASGADTIKFNIPGDGPHTIPPDSALPSITEPVIIDGYSQPGASPNTLAVGNDAVLKIELSGAGAANGLEIEADNSTVKGLVISVWENGVEVHFTVGDPNEGATGNRILSNSIYDNGDDGEELGIDLILAPNDPPGHTENDPPPDADEGPNNLQNHPELDRARTRRGATTIKGTLTSTPDETFVIQFFSSLAADPSGFGEGQKFKGQKSVTDTDGDGIITFTFKPKKKVPRGQLVTATATNQTTGDTSEFSGALPVS
jgi:hypothetical protein